MKCVYRRCDETRRTVPLITFSLSDFRSEGMLEIDELERGSLLELFRKEIAL